MGRSMRDSPRIPIYTIGYGKRSIEDVLALLRRYDISFLIDVRSKPYSRFSPDFSRERLEARLRLESVQYVFMGDTLGGRPDDPSCYTSGHVDYEKCCESPLYQQGITRLRTAWEKQLRVALLCSEAKPQECHRSKLIGTTLAKEGIEVRHIDEGGELKTQQQVIEMLTSGQQSLFSDGLSGKGLSMSRRRYQSP